MKGTTHLAIGAVIGMAAGLERQLDFDSGIICVIVGAFSALTADLDGKSILSGKIGKFSKMLRETILSLGVLLSVVLFGMYRFAGFYQLQLTVLAAVLLILGFTFKEGFIRNLIVSLIGAALIFWGQLHGLIWLSGLGLFIGIAPWLKHRGMTHTLWAAAAWTAIAWGFEGYIGEKGIAAVAGLGYLSHLAADTLTPAGVKWLFPLYKGTFKIPLF